MFMIPTIKPYGSVNIHCIDFVMKNFDKFYLVDKCGKWEIEEKEYKYLKGKGIPEYGRVYSTL